MPRVHEEPIDKLVFVWAALHQLDDLPVQVLDRNMGIGPDLPLAGEGRIGGLDDDALVGYRGDRVRTRFEVSGEKFVERLPAAAWTDVVVHVVTGRIVEGLDRLRGQRLRRVEPLLKAPFPNTHCRSQ